MSFVPGEYYHIYNRGNSKQKIFLSKKDYERFIVLLHRANTEGKFNFFDSQKGGEIWLKKAQTPLISIGAYCLMPNHFHILITPISDDSLSKFMQKVSTAYSMYFNEKYKRTGSLFEGKFKSQHVATDRHLKYLFSYIHLNPIKLIDKEWDKTLPKNRNAFFNYLQTYPYSSFLDYNKEHRKEGIILNGTSFPAYFPKRESFERETIDWLTYREARPND